MEPSASLELTPPAGVRAINWVAAPLGPRVADLSADSFMRWAERTTGLDDWGGNGIERRIEACADAVQYNDNLTAFGRLSLRFWLHVHFTNHLKVVDFVKRHPDVRDVPVEAPLVITGYYRTGTTLLHNLLGADPRHHLPMTWELTLPVPMSDNPEVDRRLRRSATHAMFAANRYAIPDQAAAHNIEVDGPEECFFLTENDGAGTTLFNTYQAYDYAFDQLEWDLRPTYEFLKLQYQVLTYRRPKRRLVLKCPWHLWNLDTLLAVFPDAKIVQTHRSILKSLPSNCSLSAMTTSKFAKEIDLPRLGAFWRDFYRVGLERSTRVRETIPANQLFDVRLSDLAKDPVELFRTMYDHFGMEWSDHLDARYRVRMRENPKDQHGVHVYTLKDFGLDAKALTSEYAEYHERFGVKP